MSFKLDIYAINHSSGTLYLIGDIKTNLSERTGIDEHGFSIVDALPNTSLLENLSTYAYHPFSFTKVYKDGQPPKGLFSVLRDGAWTDWANLFNHAVMHGTLEIKEVEDDEKGDGAPFYELINMNDSSDGHPFKYEVSVEAYSPHAVTLLVSDCAGDVAITAMSPSQVDELILSLGRASDVVKRRANQLRLNDVDGKAIVDIMREQDTGLTQILVDGDPVAHVDTSKLIGALRMWISTIDG